MCYQVPCSSDILQYSATTHDDSDLIVPHDNDDGVRETMPCSSPKIKFYNSQPMLGDGTTDIQTHATPNTNENDINTNFSSKVTSVV